MKNNLTHIFDALPSTDQNAVVNYMYSLLHERERRKFMSAMDEAQADIDAGRILSDAALWTEMEKEFGPIEARE